MIPKAPRKKIEQIEFYGGKTHLVERSDQIYDESKRLANELNGHYIDQFTYAERATDWRGNNNMAPIQSLAKWKEKFTQSPHGS